VGAEGEMGAVGFGRHWEGDNRGLGRVADCGGEERRGRLVGVAAYKRIFALYLYKLLVFFLIFLHRYIHYIHPIRARH